MDPTATPWRVLEDPAERTNGAGAPAPAQVAVSRSALLMAAGVAVLIVVAFVLAFGAGASGTIVLDGGTPLGSATLTGAAGAPEPATASAGVDLVVEIVGAIGRPGVFRVPAGARVGDLVEAAGGYGARVDTERASRELNLAAPLHDGDQIRVPSRDDAVTAGQEPADGPASGGASGSANGSGPVDLNKATNAELEALPGIGPVTASKILASRDEQRFGAVDDLRTRGLLGEKTYEKVKDLVTVR